MKCRFLLVLIIFLIGCATTTPKATNINNSALAITIGAGIRSGVLTVEAIKPQKIFFVRLDSKNDSLMKKEGFLSTYSRESLWGSLKKDSIDTILFDVEPGIYAPVAAFCTGRQSHKDFIILFPEKMIKSAIVNLKPNSMAYAGKFIFKKAPLLNRMEKADKVQKYYYSKLNRNLQFYCVAPSLKDEQHSSEIEKKFLTKYSSILKNTEWKEKINNRIAELEGN